MSSSLRELHDATLTSIELEWSVGRVTICFRTANGRIELYADDVSTLQVPRALPWGASSSVNEVKQSTPSSRKARIEIEVQSGDVIVVEAASFQWSEGAA